tara:strand:- start:397 stop:1491 length:1095 start_codon:yes stop_codon:yes gene_type:complete
MTILRITRTYPNVKYKSIGLQTYMVSKYSNYKSIIFSKKSKYKILKNSNSKNIETYYPELSINKNFLNNLIAIILKIIANIIFFIKVISKLIFNFQKIKLIHIHNLNFLLCGILLKKIFNKKVFLSIGGTDIKRLKNKKLFQNLIKSVDLVFSVSINLKKKFNKIYPKTKCEYISNGVDLNIFKYKNFSKKKFVLAIGNIRWQKDYSTMIKAYQKSNIKNQYNLLICGEIIENFEFKKITKLVEKYKLKKKVSFLGFCSQKKILKLLKSSKFLIISSVSEGLPKVILESIACGIPVISTNVGDNPAILKNTGLISTKKNSKTMAINMNKMISNKKLYKKLTKNCKSERLKYSWRNISQNIHCYY